MKLPNGQYRIVARTGKIQDLAGILYTRFGASTVVTFDRAASRRLGWRPLGAER